MALKRNTTPPPVDDDAYEIPEDTETDPVPDGDSGPQPTEAEWAENVVSELPAKKPRVQTKAGRLGAAEKAVEKAKAKQDKLSRAFEKLQQQTNEAADAYEEAQRELGEALAAFGVSTTRETTPATEEN